jgi:hypothetical protein
MRSIQRSLRARRALAALGRSAGGSVIIEFAVGFPVLLAMGMYGIDTANMALTNLKLNQIALNLADNASRVGTMSTLSKQQMRVVDVEDVFIAAQNHGAAIKLKENSRVILSSLEKDSSGVQRIHWQRCFGDKTGATYESHYGKVKNTDGDQEATSTSTTNVGQATTTGMGASGAKVNAPTNDSGVMFVEINYRYTPLFGWLYSPADLRFVSSFIVRDKRDFSQLYNSTTTTSYECGYAAREAPPA